MDRLVIFLILLWLVVMFIIYVVLPIIGILISIGLGLIGLLVFAGAVSGFVVAGRNFVAVLREAHKELP